MAEIERTSVMDADRNQLVMESENRISFSLVSLQEERFELRPEANPTLDDLRIQYLVESEIHPDEEYIYVRTGIRYRVEETVVCECVLGMKFSIDSFHSVISIDESSKKINFTSNLMPTFLNMTYGALRGALYERVKDTPMESFPLPLISMQELEKSNHFQVIR